MLSRMVGSRVTPVIAQMMTTEISLRCLLNDMTMRLVAPVQLHLHHRQTPTLLAIFERMRQDQARQA